MVSEADEIRAAIKSQANRLQGLMTEDTLTIFDLRRENKVLRNLAKAVGEGSELDIERAYWSWRKLKERKDG